MGGRAGRELRPEAVLAWARRSQARMLTSPYFFLVRPSMSVVTLPTLLRTRAGASTRVARCASEDVPYAGGTYTDPQNACPSRCRLSP